jgi:hypothetical protein
MGNVRVFKKRYTCIYYTVFINPQKHIKSVRTITVQIHQNCLIDYHENIRKNFCYQISSIYFKFPFINEHIFMLTFSTYHLLGFPPFIYMSGYHSLFCSGHDRASAYTFYCGCIGCLICTAVTLDYFSLYCLCSPILLPVSCMHRKTSLVSKMHPPVTE